MEQVLRRTAVALGAALAVVMWLPTAVMAGWGVNVGVGSSYGALFALVGALPTFLALVGLFGWWRTPDRTATVASALGLFMIAALPIDILMVLLWGIGGFWVPF